MSTITMQELELETAELLPARETLCGQRYHYASSSVTQLNASHNGNGDGNVEQGGLFNVAIGNGDFNGDGSGNNINL
jgi:hypothetical protein